MFQEAEKEAEAYEANQNNHNSEESESINSTEYFTADEGLETDSEEELVHKNRTEI